MTSTGSAAHSDGENDHIESGYRYRRAELRARLAAERAQLLNSLLGLKVEVLEGRPLQGITSAAGMLSAVAAREESFVSVLTQPVEGPATEMNPEIAINPLPAGFDDALARCVGARTRFLDAFARIPDAVVFGDPAKSGSALSPLSMATQCHWSDASLSVRVSAWSRDYETGGSTGPISLLLATVRAARKELLTTVALVPTEARELAVFDGGRTLPQIFRLIAELERSFLGYLARAGCAPVEAARQPTGTRDDRWKSAWSDLHAVHAALIQVLDTLSPAAYATTIGNDHDAESVYTWARGCLLHDRLRGAHIRAALELDWPERLLR